MTEIGPRGQDRYGTFFVVVVVVALFCFFSFVLVTNCIESQNTPDFKNREKSGNAGSFVQRSKYAGCYDFGIQEKRNALFRKLKEMCTV